MADAMFRYAVTTGFFIGLVAILFGTRVSSSLGIYQSNIYQYLVSSSDSLFFRVQIMHPMRN
jgi:hypothetical protein